MKKIIAVFLAILLILGAFQVLPSATAQAAVGTLTEVQIDSAIAWAKSHLNDSQIERPGRFTLIAGKHCGSFVWSTFYYGCGIDLYPSRGYTNAAEMREDMRSQGLLFTTGTPPKGAIVFFNIAPDGHVGLSIGNGEYIHLGSYNVNIAKLSDSTNYVGWSRPFEYLLPNDSSVISIPTPQVLSTPTGLTAKQNTSNSVSISWNAVSGATSYEVQYQTLSSSGWKVDYDYTNKTATSYISTGLNNDYTYQYRVRAVNSAGTSGWAEVSYNKLPTVQQPAGISLSNTSLTITSFACYYLTATVTPSNATNSSVIWKSSTPTVATVDSTGMVEPKTNGTTTITATTANNISASCVVTVKLGDPPSAPSTPTGLRVDYSYSRESTNPPSYAATVSWNTVAGAAYYEVEFMTSTNSTWRVETDYTNNTATSYVSGSDSGMVYGRTYNFRVRAVNASGKSGWAEVSYSMQTPTAPPPAPTPTPTPPPTPAPEPVPSAPTGLRVDYSYSRESTNPPSYAATVSWNAVSGAAYYEVEFMTSTNTTWRVETDYTNNTATSYVSGSDSGMVYGRTYNFRVRAVNSSGKSGWAEVSYVRQ